jgi:FkbM family methyltransferase
MSTQILSQSQAAVQLSPADRLDSCLGESVEAARQREQSAFDELASPYERNLVLFGAGALGRRTLAGLRKAGIEPRAFCDNGPHLWGRQVEGIKVYSPQDAARRFGDDSAFVVTIWNGHGRDRMSQRTAQLSKLGCRRVVPVGLLFWKYPETFLPYYPLDLPHKLLLRRDEARAALDFWDDEASRREYAAQIAFRLHLDYDSLGWPPENAQYFPASHFRLTPNETLVDCGAFDGDTILRFIAEHGKEFHRIFAFEPDPLNWSKLQNTLRTLPSEAQSKIAAFPYAVGAASGNVQFNATGTDLSAVGSGALSVECVELDKILANEAPTLMKFDIEGAELDALRGGRNVIRQYSPILAVSAYHQQSHLWEVPAAIRAISGNYKYLLRPQSSEAWDLVCYAAPADRLIEGGTA